MLASYHPYIPMGGIMRACSTMLASYHPYIPCGTMRAYNTA